MKTCRRTYLDEFLKANVSLIKGKVLDIGGVKGPRRGDFVPPTESVESWQCVNNNPVMKPDYCCDASQIPVAEGDFDTAILTEVLEYIREPQAVINEAFRVLALGGNCLITIPFMHPAHGDFEQDRVRFTEVKLTELCSLAGFEVVLIKPAGSLFSVVYDFLYVTLGYARPKPQRIYLKVLRRFLWLFKPLCLWLDGFSHNTKKYINTGYFVILKKANG